MREFDGKPGDRVTHKHYGQRATLVDVYLGACGVGWLVRLVANKDVGLWDEENLIPESPMEALARALEEDHAV